MPSSQRAGIIYQVLIVIATALVSAITVKTTLLEELKFAKERNELMTAQVAKVDSKIEKLDDRLDIINSRLGQIEGRLHITR
jgi:hypothetical protein